MASRITPQEIQRYVGPYALGQMTGVAALGAANRTSGCLVSIPATGILKDIIIWVGTSSGNIDVGIYDTKNPRNRLWSLGTTACPVTTAWANLGDPNIHLQQGQVVDFHIACDNNTATFGQYNRVTSHDPLPIGVIAGHEATPYISYQVATSFVLPTTLSQANFLASTRVWAIFARIE